MWLAGAVKFTKLTMYSRSESFCLFHLNLILNLLRLLANKPILTLCILGFFLLWPCFLSKLHFCSWHRITWRLLYIKTMKEKTVPIKLWFNGLTTVQHSAWISYTIASSCFKISLIYLRTFSNFSWLQLLITDMRQAILLHIISVAKQNSFTCFLRFLVKALVCSSIGGKNWTGHSEQ